MLPAAEQLVAGRVNMQEIEKSISELEVALKAELEARTAAKDSCLPLFRVLVWTFEHFVDVYDAVVRYDLGR